MDISSPFSLASSRGVSESPRLRNFGPAYNDMDLGGLDFHQIRAGSTTPVRSSALLMPHYRGPQVSCNYIDRCQ